MQELRQDVIVDLVDQCRTYKQRVVQLVNSTSYVACQFAGALSVILSNFLLKFSFICWFCINVKLLLSDVLN